MRDGYMWGEEATSEMQHAAYADEVLQRRYAEEGMGGVPAKRGGDGRREGMREWLGGPVETGSEESSMSARGERRRAVRAMTKKTAAWCRRWGFTKDAAEADGRVPMRVSAPCVKEAHALAQGWVQAATPEQAELLLGSLQTCVKHDGARGLVWCLGQLSASSAVHGWDILTHVEAEAEACRWVVSGFTAPLSANGRKYAACLQTDLPRLRETLELDREAGRVDETRYGVMSGLLDMAEPAAVVA